MSKSVLMLNSSFYPIRICTMQSAFTKLYIDQAKAVEIDYTTYTFSEWVIYSDLHFKESPISKSPFIGTSLGRILIPHTIKLTEYDELPPVAIRLNRKNLLIRDNNECQYCGKNLSRFDFTLDHVVPRVQGGKTEWNNVVASCSNCNRIKGPRTPLEAKMHLKKSPIRLTWNTYIHHRLSDHPREEWRQFLSDINKVTFKNNS